MRVSVFPSICDPFDNEVPFLFKQWGEHDLSYDRDRDDPDYRRCAEVARAPGRWINIAGGHGFNGERVPMSPRELALTELLLQKAGRVVTKESIVARLSSWEADFSENSVEVYVHRLRKRFAPLGVVIKTVRGFGYVVETADVAGPAAPA